MARKSRTPPPPRRVQAPKTRRAERPSRKGLYLLIGALAIAAAAAVGAFLLIRESRESRPVAQVLREAGCTFRTFPVVGSNHINDIEAEPEAWNSFPPTSGPHYFQPAIWGDYDEPVSLAQAVHNLEHGGIVVYYGDDVPDEQVEELRRFYRDDPTAMLLAPLPRLADKIALTAWYAPNAPERAAEGAQGVLAECTRVDQDAFQEFRDEYRFKGPERFRPEDLQPGS